MGEFALNKNKNKQSKVATFAMDYVNLIIDLIKANDAEQSYSRSLQDTSRVTYALVVIKNGDSVLKDVLIDGISMEEIVRTEQLNKK